MGRCSSEDWSIIRPVNCSCSTSLPKCQLLSAGSWVALIVTVTGNVAQPRNYDVLLGTPMDHVVRLAGPGADTDRYIMGGPMMGLRMPSFDVLVVKATKEVSQPDTRHRA